MRDIRGSGEQPATTSRRGVRVHSKRQRDISWKKRLGEGEYISRAELERQSTRALSFISDSDALELCARLRGGGEKRSCEVKPSASPHPHLEVEGRVWAGSDSDGVEMYM